MTSQNEGDPTTGELMERMLGCSTIEEVNELVESLPGEAGVLLRAINAAMTRWVMDGMTIVTSATQLSISGDGPTFTRGLRQAIAMAYREGREEALADQVNSAIPDNER